MELTPQKKDPSGERPGRLTPLVFPCPQEELRKQGQHSACQPCCFVHTSVADRRAFRSGQLPSVYMRGREREREREVVVVVEVVVMMMV
jgi:hypothetical protein